MPCTSMVCLSLLKLTWNIAWASTTSSLVQYMQIHVFSARYTYILLPYVIGLHLFAQYLQDYSNLIPPVCYYCLFFPGVFGTVEMSPPTVGTWLVECTLGDYQMAGMRAKLLVYNPRGYLCYIFM